MTTTVEQPRLSRLLLVEDSPGDVRLTKEPFRETNPAVVLHVAADGEEAMAFLRQEGRHADAPRPDLILLGLNLPKLDGHELLALIKEDAALKSIHSRVTTSAAEANIAESYKLHANSYFTKPVGFEEFDGLVKCINEFWLEKAKLP